jgi:hypothetical protein
MAIAHGSRSAPVTARAAPTFYGQGSIAIADPCNRGEDGPVTGKAVIDRKLVRAETIAKTMGARGPQSFAHPHLQSLERELSAHGSCA